MDFPHNSSKTLEGSKLQLPLPPDPFKHHNKTPEIGDLELTARILEENKRLVTQDHKILELKGLIPSQKSYRKSLLKKKNQNYRFSKKYEELSTNNMLSDNSKKYYESMLKNSDFYDKILINQKIDANKRKIDENILNVEGYDNIETIEYNLNVLKHDISLITNFNVNTQIKFSDRKNYENRTNLEGLLERIQIDEDSTNINSEYLYKVLDDKSDQKHLKSLNGKTSDESTKYNKSEKFQEFFERDYPKKEFNLMNYRIDRINDIYQIPGDTDDKKFNTNLFDYVCLNSITNPN